MKPFTIFLIISTVVFSIIYIVFIWQTASLAGSPVQIGYVNATQNEREICHSFLGNPDSSVDCYPIIDVAITIIGSKDPIWMPGASCRSGSCASIFCLGCQVHYQLVFGSLLIVDNNNKPLIGCIITLCIMTIILVIGLGLLFYQRYHKASWFL